MRDVNTEWRVPRRALPFFFFFFFFFCFVRFDIMLRRHVICIVTYYAMMRLCITFRLVFGLVLEAAGWGVNKQLWSPSYLFVTAGMCGYCLATMYVIFDLDTLGSPGADAVQRLLRTM